MLKIQLINFHYCIVIVTTRGGDITTRGGDADGNRGEKLSRTTHFGTFRGRNFREKGKKPRNRESFFPRKFLPLKYAMDKYIIVCKTVVGNYINCTNKRYLLAKNNICLN